MAIEYRVDEALRLFFRIKNTDSNRNSGTSTIRDRGAVWKLT